MAMARHWRLCGCRLSSTVSASPSSGPIRFQNMMDKFYCSLETPSQKLQPLTLENLGFRDDYGKDVDVDVDVDPVRALQERRHPRQQVDASDQKPVARRRAPQAPSAEEKKQAALDASFILAKVAGMRLGRPKHAASALSSEGEAEQPKHAASALSSAGEAEQPLRQQEGEKYVEEEVEDLIEEEEEEEEEEKEGWGRGRPHQRLGVKHGAQEAAQPSTLNHPWPEWLDFLKALQTNGFFEGSEREVDEGKHPFESFGAVKYATNAYGRKHAEIFNCLSRKDLRVLADYGCPDAERKASNASKRLRAHFQIKEGDVCQHCRLKMTCPRAYFAPESKIRMNTLDVVRIVTGYATNVWPDADSYMSYPEEIGTSVRNLLREILVCKVSTRDAVEDKNVPAERVLLDSEKNVNKKVKNNPLPVDQKPGDWTCPNCEFLNFGRNRRCRECRVCRPPRQEMKIAYAGDWHCPKCRYMNFSKNSQCRECKFERPTNVTWMGGERVTDDRQASDKLPPKRASDKLPHKERNYEASDEEGMSDMSFPDGPSRSDSDATLSDEEEKALAKGLANAARKLAKPSFKWEDVKEGAESFLHLNVTSKASKLPKGKSKDSARPRRLRKGSLLS